MIARRSLEFRLAAWYSLLLLVGLAALGGALWFGVDYSMTRAVDDLLVARVEALRAFVHAELGDTLPDLTQGDEEGEVKSTIEEVDPEGRWVAMAGDKIFLTPETRFDSDFSEFSRADLAPGMYVGVEVERAEGRWVAFEISQERDFDSELRVELREYVMGAPEGSMIEVRTAGGEAVLAASAPIEWLEAESPGRSIRTVGPAGAQYRVLRGSLDLVGRPYEIQVATDFKAVAIAQHRLVGLLVPALPLSLVLCVGGGYLISRRALRPIEDIVDVAGTMTVERLSERLEYPHSGDVVERLGDTLNAMLDRLEASVKRLEEFTADASHELRSPVSVIRTTAELALRHDRSAEELRGDMAAIEEEAGRLTELIEDLLTLARADGAVDAAPMEAVDLGELAREVGEQYRLLHAGRRITIEAPPVVMRGHAPSLRRLLVILLDNAAQHTPPDAEVTIQAREGDNGPEVAVRDTGEGIPPDVLPRIFDRFYRSDGARNRTGGGFGLGLSIAKWIVESHGGRITAQSRPGEGTAFLASFPRPA